jgi:hypothetical protein
LIDVMTVKDGSFTFNASFYVDPNVKSGDWMEWMLFVYPQPYGEGVCVEFGNTAYLNYRQAITNPSFSTFCKDNGKGSFTYAVEKIKGNPVPASLGANAAVQASSPCSMDWFYCTNDATCSDWSMSVVKASLTVLDSAAVRPQDGARVQVNGTTSLSRVPMGSSFSLVGPQGDTFASGPLYDVMALSGCAKGVCNFGISVNGLTLPYDLFTADNWFQYSLVVYVEGREGMCVSVANQAVVKYYTGTPKFTQLCSDGGDGHFTARSQAAKTAKASCTLA